MSHSKNFQNISLVPAYNALNDLFSMFGLVLEYDEQKSVITEQDKKIGVDIFCEQNKGIKFTLFLIIQFDVAKKLTSKMLEMNDVSDDDIDESLKEVINIAGGHVIKGLPTPEEEKHYNLDVPFFVKDISSEVLSSITISFNEENKINSFQLILN